VVGKFVSEYAVNFPVKPDPSPIWDKITGKAPTDFEPEFSFIYKLFNFPHTCVVLDFNPAKTISALVIQFNTIPMNIFIVCHYIRITSQPDPMFDNLKKFTKIASPLQFIFNTYFYMVFVNSPDGEYGTKDGMVKFILHYVPFMLWHSCLLMMAIQQSWYLSLKDDMPFSWVTPGLTMFYCKLLVVWFVVYHLFVWSYITDFPLWDTSTDSGVFAANCIMYGWNIVAILIPIIFAYFEQSPNTKFTYEELE
jgi:hypothetical protein